jgi:hypothetical protein
MGDIADWHEDQYYDWLFGPDRYDDCHDLLFERDFRRSPAEDFPDPPPEWPPAEPAK